MSTPTLGITPDLLDGTLADDLAAASLDLAKAFYAGATLWCLAPEWEPHAHHVAVEFVHPVVMGKKSLPSFALTGRKPVQQARVSVRSGDVILAIADADDAVTLEIMARAQAWGAKTLWIGSGRRPHIGAADHVLWQEGPEAYDPTAPATGRFVLMYHLLWELTHVCFEHPGLLKPKLEACTDEVCITCSDEGRPAEVITPPSGPFGKALVRTESGNEEIDVTLVGEVVPGDLLLVHAGSALTKLELADFIGGAV